MKAISASSFLLMRLLVSVLSRRIRAQSSSSLPISVAFWPIFLAIAGLAVNLRLVCCDCGAVQPLSAAHCVKEAQSMHTYCLAIFGWVKWFAHCSEECHGGVNKAPIQQVLSVSRGITHSKRSCVSICGARGECEGNVGEKMNT